MVGKSMASLGAQQAQKDRAAAEEGGFEVDVEDMAERVKELQDMRRTKMKELWDLAEPLTNVGGFGNEPVSQGYLEIVNKSGKSYQQFLNEMDEFLQAYIDKMKDAVRDYIKAEEAASEEIPNVE